MMIERLTSDDLINLYVETPSAPVRIGAVAILEAGDFGLAHVRAAIDTRLHRVPRLRQIIHRAGPLGGRPVWVDDPGFRVDRHVHEVALPAGTDLTDLAMRLVTRPFDHRHPLWHIWFVTGLPGGRVAVVLGMHHVMADGATTVRLIGALMDPADGIEGARRVWTARRPPSWGALVLNNLRGKVSGVRRPKRGPALRRMLAVARDAPHTSLNHPVGAHRRLAALTLDLAEVKEAAHRHQGKVNDVVLALAAGGIRDLLAARSEPVDGVRPYASVAVSLRGSDVSLRGSDVSLRGSDVSLLDNSVGDVGNRTGAIAVGLPLDADPHRRLRRIARESAEAKAHQPVTASNALLVWLARLGLLRWFSRRQHMINIVESNLAGPRETMHLLGAPVTGIVPIGTLAGNISLGFLALSYAGRLTIAVQADADRYPDLPLLLAAMRRDAGVILDGLSSAVQSGPGSAAGGAG